MEKNFTPQSDKPYHLYLSREQFNQLIETIELMLAVDEDNEVTKDAAKCGTHSCVSQKSRRKTGMTALRSSSMKRKPVRSSNCCCFIFRHSDEQSRMITFLKSEKIKRSETI